MSRKRYYLLTDINRSVDRLITGLLQTQDVQFDILGRLEAIRGMLIDLMYHSAMLELIYINNNLSRATSKGKAK